MVGIRATYSLQIKKDATGFAKISTSGLALARIVFQVRQPVHIAEVELQSLVKMISLLRILK
jgi:hypothetical protein